MEKDRGIVIVGSGDYIGKITKEKISEMQEFVEMDRQNEIDFSKPIPLVNPYKENGLMLLDPPIEVGKCRYNAHCNSNKQIKSRKKSKQAKKQRKLNRKNK